MLITGVEDKRTPMSETEQFYQALKIQKVDSVLVKVPGSPHGIASKPSRMIGKVENILAWFKNTTACSHKVRKLKLTIGVLRLSGANAPTQSVQGPIF